MAGDKKPYSSLLPIWGILVLFFGIVLLLQAINILPWGIWVTIFKFWPALIIIFGLWLLLGRRHIWLLSAIVIALLGIFLGVSIWQLSPNFSDQLQTESYSVPLGSMTAADVDINFSAGRISISPTTIDDNNLVAATPERRNNHSTLEGDFSEVGGIGKLFLKTVNQMFWGGNGVRWELAFSQVIPIKMTLKLDAATCSLNLNNIKVAELNLRMDVSSGKLILPAYVDSGVVNIHADVSSLEIIVPEGVAAKIRTDAKISIVEIDKSRFKKEGDYYVSPGFESATNRLELNIVCDICRLTVK